MKTLSKKDSSKVKESLEFILNNSVNEITGELSFIVTIEYEFAIEIITKTLPELNDFLDMTKNDLVLKTIKRYISYKKYHENPDLLKAYRDALSLEIKRVKKKYSKYTILMFLNLNQNSIKAYSEFIVLGNKLKPMDFKNINYIDINLAWNWLGRLKRLDDSLIEIGDSRYLPTPIKFTPIVVDIFSYEPRAATQTAIKSFNLLRCFFHAPLMKDEYTFLVADSLPMSKILPSPYYLIFDDNGKLLKLYSTKEHNFYSVFTPPRKQYAVVSELLKIYKDRDNNNYLLTHLMKILQLYQNALDGKGYTNVFLALWQVLERGVTIGNERLKFDEITSRINNLLGLEKLFKFGFNLVFDYRNKIIHSGDLPEIGASVNIYKIAKLLVDFSIKRLYSLSEEYSTRAELIEYLNLVGKEDSALIRTKSIIEKIIS